MGTLSAGKRIVLRVARQVDCIPGQCDGIAHSTDILQVLDKPLVVVSEVVDPIRKRAVTHHRGMVGPCGGLLMPYSIKVLIEF